MPRPRLRQVICPGILAIVAMPTSASAQVDERQLERIVRQIEETSRPRVDPRLSLTERSLVEVGGYAGFAAIYLTDSTNNSRRLYQPEVTLFSRAIIDGGHTFFARARFQYRDYSEGDSFDGRGDRWREPFFERWWYEFDLASLMAGESGMEPRGNINVRVGRQFVDWGLGLALSEQLYAIRPNFSWERVSLEGLFGETPDDESIIDFDASRRGYNRDTKRRFYGGLLRYTAADDNQFYGFVLHMEDRNGTSRPRAPIGAVDFEYNATYFGVGADGAFTPQLRYNAEFVYQIGDSRSDPLRSLGNQTKEDIRAWALSARLSYFFRGDHRPFVYFETIAASGDDDRLVTTDTVGGNQPGTNDTAFNSLGFANTGLAFAPALSNILMFRTGGAFFPFPQEGIFRDLQLGADFILHNKLDADAPIEERTSNNMFLGFETDLILNWRITHDLSIVGRYGIFFPGDAIETTSSTRQFIYGGITVSF